MRYALMRKMDISNGTFVGVSLFVQGCPFHCKGCFNQETWDFDGGHEWTEDAKETFLSLADKPYIKRVTILGGEPLAPQNVSSVLDLMKEIKARFPEKDIWLYTGYRMPVIMNPAITDDFNPERDKYLSKRKEVLKYADVIVDGPFIESEKDITLKFRGSSNQNIWVKNDDGEWVNTTKANNN